MARPVPTTEVYQGRAQATVKVVPNNPTLAPVSRLGKEKPLMEMLINGRTVMIRDAIFHNHATGKSVFFLYKLKSVVYNALLSAGKLPPMVDYI